jgi:hypothetical protein
VRVAYSIRSGNPLGKYHPADFKLEEAPISIASTGLTLTHCSGERQRTNELLADVNAGDFSLTITGFDENRDLFVRVTVPKEVSDDDQAA